MSAAWKLLIYAPDFRATFSAGASVTFAGGQFDVMTMPPSDEPELPPLEPPLESPPLDPLLLGPPSGDAPPDDGAALHAPAPMTNSAATVKCNLFIGFLTAGRSRPRSNDRFADLAPPCSHQTVTSTFRFLRVLFCGTPNRALVARTPTLGKC